MTNSRARLLLQQHNLDLVDEGLFGLFRTKKSYVPPQFDQSDPYQWDLWVNEFGDPAAVDFNSQYFDVDTGVQYNIDKSHLTAHELKALEKQEQKDLRKAFKEANPHVLARVKAAATAHDWSRILTMLAKGSFWTLATYVAPWFFIPAGGVIGYKRWRNRQDVKNAWGIKKRIRLTTDVERAPRGAARQHFRQAWRDVHGYDKQAPAIRGSARSRGREAEYLPPDDDAIEYDAEGRGYNMGKDQHGRWVHGV
jgi:hypothetical protein